MSDKKSSMREGPLSELFRPTAGDAEPPAPEAEPPAWGREAPSFGDRTNYLAVIKCVGVGGAGVNAINRRIEAGIRGVEFIAVNTDRQSLDATDAAIRIPVGIDLTRGRGTGGDPALGEQALRESEEQLRRALRGADLVFIATGEGGGTGTGGAPIVAKLAREMGALTVAVVTRPFGFEGSRRGSMADQGVALLREQADTIIVIQNDRLLTVLERGVSMVDAFRVCDDLLRQGVQGITDLITLPGLINLDFADVRTVIRGAGTALLGIGYASGGDRAEEAALAAISSPLLETPIDGARGILLGITGGPDLSLSEISRAAKVVSDAADPDANIIFGATVDPELEGKVWVTVVAAGFSGKRAVSPRPAAVEPAPRSAAPAAPASIAPPTPIAQPTPVAPAQPVQERPAPVEPAAPSAPSGSGSGPAPTFPPIASPAPSSQHASAAAEPPSPTEFTDIGAPDAPDEPPEAPDFSALTEEERNEPPKEEEIDAAAALFGDLEDETTLFSPPEPGDEPPTLLHQPETAPEPAPEPEPDPQLDIEITSVVEPVAQAEVEEAPAAPVQEDEPEAKEESSGGHNPVTHLFRSLKRDRHDKDDEPPASS